MAFVTFGRPLRPLAGAIALAATLAHTVTSQGPAPADLVLLDARSLTVDAAFRTGAALAVRDGRFVAVGDNYHMLSAQGLRVFIAPFSCPHRVAGRHEPKPLRALDVFFALDNDHEFRFHDLGQTV